MERDFVNDFLFLFLMIIMFEHVGLGRLGLSA